MLLATLPERYARLMGVDWLMKNEVWPDGRAKYVPIPLPRAISEIGHSCRKNG